MSEHNNSHGNTKSYAIGFILSLIFTLIPYYLVVNKTISGNGLMYTILGFATIQMLIQIFFFLHLGRGPKPWYNVVFFIGTVGLIIVTVAGSIFIMNNLYHNMAPTEVTTRLAEDEGIAKVGGKETGACQGLNDNHKVTIKNGVVSPQITEAHLCDTLTFINEDPQLREIGFGDHEKHTSYGGEYEVVLRQGRAKSIVLNQYGFYNFHDHLDEDTAGSFRVTEE